ncbi:DUF262 domain-containing protein [Microcoleus sp. FACHB-831]|uniref:GmrSD restriction endonuclease domain-containing protein n=1 Tax=Microcoleus sp. FACHB-831 TaxID=2692827 RepID=UPI0016895E86|nr:DUF262 domain-containing protein [Microcoleus sp. FACHB-831]MBD1924567.1 DUF262 domain-containing protein [Microcoleus sp. FACHB-831]
MADTYIFLKDLINDLERGRIRIPSFQRGFVWEPERVSNFIDSIYKGFPFGSVLLWRTKNRLRTERNLGPYKLQANDPDYPIDYVLDGQQRITSIFGIFQTSITAEENEETNWTNLFFELNSKESVPFCYLKDGKSYDESKYFPLQYVFNSPKYRQITRNLNEDLAGKIDDLVDRFTKATIPIERFESEERKYVATVFERINRQGVDLDTFQLLSVWNWSDDFDLQEKFKEISEELEPFGFREVGSDLLLKCCSAVVMNCADPEDFIQLSDSSVRQKFPDISTGIFRAIDFLKTDLNVFSLKLLPMENILPVLTSFFASPQKQPHPVPQDQYEIIKRWFWRSCFSQRYARGGAKSTDADLSEVQKLKKGALHKLGDFDVSLDTDYFLKNDFRMSSVATKTFILLLAQNKPLNFIQGTNISLEKVLSQGNRKEFHHIFPKAYLKSLSNKYKDEQINCLANFSILSRTDNNKIKDQPPSKYKLLMPKDNQIVEKILATHFCPTEMLTEDYDKFLPLRAGLLLTKAQELSQIK